MATSQTSLTGKLLLATPNVDDPRFHQAVIFIVSDNHEGTIGLMINFPILDLSYADLLSQTGIPLPDKPPASDKRKVHILSGGPMDTGHGFLLHSADYNLPETVCVTPHFSVTSTTEALQDVANGQGPQEYLLILGYAGWEVGQLEKELAQTAWLVIDADYDLLFNTSPDACWTRAYGRLGIDPARLSATSGRA
ncbi:MAG: YqgE/AlgH family protein [Pseudomonadota bacterium]